MKYEQVTIKDTEKIKELSLMATEILREHYNPIVGEVQNEYMLRKFQSVEAITKQLQEEHLYYFVIDDENRKVGFIAFYPVEKKLYLSKFYLYKDTRGRGISKDMLNFVFDSARKLGLTSVFLNVNRFNSAVYIYEKLGFKRVGEEKRDIGNGYFMDDYVYEYILE